jgi:trehalose 6-phosphate synthase
MRGDELPSGWGARWLQRRLGRHFAGKRLIVVSNREPCVHDLAPDGSITEHHPIGGLVTALDPVLRAVGGIWVAHGSGSGDRAMVDGRDCVEITGDGGGYTLRRVWLCRAEERGYYHGFSNSALWPLCHVAFEAPRFARNDWRHYQEVNRRFADVVVAEARSPSPIIFVQDYHFALLPGLLRERLPDATIVAFWHIPWPNPDRLARLPCRDAILEGLLGSDIVGFQTPQHAGHFVESVRSALGVAVDQERGLISGRTGPAAVRAYPISVEWPSRWLHAAASVKECRWSIRHELAIEPDGLMMLSVDRLEYTKGIEERLAAIRRLLARGDTRINRPVFVQIAAPSRTGLEPYRRLHQRVHAQVDAINGRFGAGGYRPVVLIDRHVQAADVFRFYRAADACHVGSLDDGMNLVAKEFVSARDDEQGVLMLSPFAGAAAELEGAIQLNPFDVDAVADGIVAALTMPSDDQAKRMRAMRRQVAENNVYQWAGRLLLDAAALRESRDVPAAALG